ncbi:MAG: Crp/Fnr family transcriptional regulator [Betaproteobacteria bacterium]
MRSARRSSLWGERTRHAYFPIQGFISLVTPVEGASALEVGLVGNEGMHGISLALGVDVSPLRSIVQGGGSALRMSAAAFKREHLESLDFRQQLNRYLYVLMSQLAQSAACTRFHQVDARLARWLLMTSDRAHADEFHITQTFLAWMLGVRRASVTVAALALQKKSLITYKRGAVIVLNRRGLEACACCCYQNDKDVYQRILGTKKRPAIKTAAPGVPLNTRKRDREIGGA